MSGGLGLAAECLVVLELSSASPKARRPPPAEDGHVVDEGVGTWQPTADEGTAGASVGGPMGRDEPGRRQPYEARRMRASAAPRDATSEYDRAEGRQPRVWCSRCWPPCRSDEVTALRGNGCVAQRGVRRLANDEEGG